MCVGDAQDAQDDAVRASASGRNFFFRDVRGDFDLEIFSSSCQDIEIFSQLSEGKIPSRYYIIRKYILRCFLSKADPQIPFLNSVCGDT